MKIVLKNFLFIKKDLENQKLNQEFRSLKNGNQDQINQD
jgi:hypothetical protein